jgi:nucleoid-associated protein YgaU
VPSETDSTSPQQPDGQFALKYRQQSTYGIWMQYDTESLGDIPPERFYVFDVNPQQVSSRSPFATSIKVTQGGGKVRESKGIVLRPMVISGTTAWTPLPKGTGLNTFLSVGNATQPGVGGSQLLDSSQNSDLDAALSQRSGFLAFFKLKYIFDLYGWELRRGNTRVVLNYFNTKEEEYWRIEPGEFVMQRRSPRAFLYDYQINFQCLELSRTGAPYRVNGKEPASTEAITTFRDPQFTKSLARVNEMIGAGNAYLEPGIADRPDVSAIGSGPPVFSSGSPALQTAQALQPVLDSMSAALTYFQDPTSSIDVAQVSGDFLLLAFDVALEALITTVGVWVTLSNEDVPPALLPDTETIVELNEFYCEARHLCDYLLQANRSVRTKFNSSIVKTNSYFVRGRAKQGGAQDIIQPAAGAVGSLDTSPFIGKSGLSLVTDVQALASANAVAQYVICSGDTIWSLAQRLLGDANRFVDLVLLNDLRAPYIVASVTNKPQGTLAWGEYICAPASNNNTNQVKPDTINQLPGSLGSTTTATGTNYQIIDTSFIDAGFPGWDDNQWIGYTATVTVSGVTDTRVVVSNDDRSITVNLPWDFIIPPGTTYQLELVLFSLGLPVPPDQQTFGTDLLVVFTNGVNTSSKRYCDIVFASGGDAALVTGLPNWMQAVNLRTRVEMGRLPLHPEYGLTAPIGMQWSLPVASLFAVSARSQLLQDPRTARVANAQWQLQGDQWSFYCELQPVNTKTFSPLNVTMP